MALVLWMQHGQDECDLNIIQTCAIRLWPKVVKYFDLWWFGNDYDELRMFRNDEWKNPYNCPGFLHCGVHSVLYILIKLSLCWQSDWFPFIYCLESLDRSSAAKQWPSCVHSAKLDLAPLRECYESPLGARVSIEALWPPGMNILFLNYWNEWVLIGMLSCSSFERGNDMLCLYTQWETVSAFISTMFRAQQNITYS